MEALVVLFVGLVIGAPIVFALWASALARRQEAIERALGDLRRELQRMRTVQGEGVPAVPHDPPIEASVPSEPDVAAALDSAEEPPIEAPPTHSMPTADVESEPRSTASTPSGVGELDFDWERWLGVRGAAVVGGIALALAGLFFVQLAIQRGWIGPAMRDGLAVGFGALALALFRPLARRGYHAQASALGGAGTVLVYLGSWAAARLHDLVPMAPAFAVMVATTAIAGFLALRAGSQILAGFALIGGLATPVLLEVGARSTGALFTYLGLLNIGALLAGQRTGWRWLARTVVAGTAFVQLAWYVPALALGAATVPTAGALGALGSIALVHLGMAQAAPRGGAKPVSTTIVLALLVQVLFVVHLGRTTAPDTSLLPIAGLAVLLGVASAFVGRGFGDRTMVLVGGLGGLAMLAAWTQMHPGRMVGDAARFARILAEFGGGALVLSLGVGLVERGGRLRGAPLAPAMATTAAGALAALGGFSAARAGEAPPWLVVSLALGFVSAVLVGAPRPASYRLAPLLGALAAFVCTTTLRPAVTPTDGTFADPGLRWLYAALALGAGLAYGSRRAGLATLGAAALALVRVEGPSAAVPATEPFVLVGIAALGGISVCVAAWAARRRGAATGGPDAPAIQAPGVDTEVLTLTAFAAAALFVLDRWFGGMAITSDLPTSLALSASLGIGAAVGFAAAFVELERRPTRSLVSAITGWIGVLPLLVVVTPGVQVIAARHSPQHGAELALLCAAAPALAAGALALARHGRERAAPLLGAAALLLAFALGHTIDVHPWLVGLGLGAAAVCAVGRKLARVDVATSGAALALLAAFVYVGFGLAGASFVRENSLLAPRLALTSCAVVLGLLQARATALRGFAGCGVFVITFLWLNLVIVNHFSAGTRIQFAAGRDSARDLSLSLGWALYAGGLLALGQLSRARALRWASLVFFIGTISKVFLFDLAALRGGYRAASFLGLAVALFTVSLVYQRWILPPRPKAG